MTTTPFRSCVLLIRSKVSTVTHKPNGRQLTAALINIYRVPEGKTLQDAKAIPISIFMKRIRGVPFPRFSLPSEEEKDEGDESADEGNED